MKENLEFLEKEVLLLLDSKRDYEESLKTLYQPFKGLMNIKNDFQIEKIEKKNTKIESNSPQISNFCSITKYNGYLLLTASFLFLSFLICFNRNIFLDIMIYNIYIAMRHLKRMNQKVLRLLIVSLVVSLIIDMSWMIVFSEVSLFFFAFV